MNASRLSIVGLMAVGLFFACEKDEPVVENAKVSFVQASSNINEGDATGVTIELELDKSTKEGGSVTIDLSDNLTYGTDYTTEPDGASGSVTLSFAAGETSKSILVKPVDNFEKNPSKVLSLTLSGTDGSIDLGTQKSYELSILNDDEVIDLTMTASKNSISENADEVTVTLTAATDLTTPGSIVIAFESSNVVYGEDYLTYPAAVDGAVTLSFESSDLVKTFSLTTIDNINLDDNKTLSISIQSYSGGVQAADQAIELSIVNDDILIDPTITTDMESLDFGYVIRGNDSIKSYSITATDLAGDVEIVSGNKRVLLGSDKEGEFNQNISVGASAFASGAVEVFVIYVGDSIGTISTTITHNTLNLPSEVSLTVSGKTGYKPGILESFEFGATADAFDNLYSSSEWLRIAGAAANFISYTPNSLSFADYPGSGDGGALSLNEANKFVNFTRPIDSLYGAGTLYISAMVHVDAIVNNDKFGMTIGRFKPDGTTQFGSRFFTSGDGSGNVKFGIAKKTGDPTYLPGVYNLDQTYVVVIKIEKFDAVEGTDDDIVSLAVFDSALPTSEPASYDAVSTVGGDVNIAALILKQTGGDNAFTIDGIQTSRDWEGILE